MPGGDDLADVARDLGRLHLDQHARKSGPEGRVEQAEWAARGGERMGEVGRVQQKCQYVGIRCGGCRQQFRLGEMMLSHGNALVHPSDACQTAHDAIVAVELAAGRASSRPATLGCSRTAGRRRGFTPIGPR